MFQPAVAITHKIMNNIVALELADQELKLRYKNLIRKKENVLILDILNTISGQGSKLSDTSLRNLIEGGSPMPGLTGFKNAYQAITVFDQSLRAEDDWNLLIRLNQLINKESLTIQDTNIRGKKISKKEFVLSPHDFADSEQVRHFTLELLRWYRKSEGEINKYFRVLILLYHSLKTSPFQKNNAGTIMIALNFWLNENNIFIFKTLPLFSIVKNIEDKDLSLNEFLNNFLNKTRDIAKKVLFDLEKHDIEANSPRKILNLSERQTEILKILQARDKISRAEAADILEVSAMTAYRDIRGLVKKRLLSERGIGRGTYYILSNKIK